MGRSKSLRLENYPTELPGEDRSYGGNEFYIDLIPKSVWFANLRAMLTPTQWKHLSNYVIERANSACEICGSTERLEAHERWHFNEGVRRQKLIRLMCVCKLCHLSIHSGLAGEFGLNFSVEEHIKKITGWRKSDLKRHRKEAKKRWEILSWLDWEIDVSIAINAGLTTYSKEEVKIRIFERRRKANEKNNSSRLIIDDIEWDFSQDTFRECVIFIAETTDDDDSEILDGLLLPNSIGSPMYTIKQFDKIPPHRPTIDVKTFISAFRRAYPVSNEFELKELLRDQSNPKRLIVSNEIEITNEMANSMLSKGIIFWSE